MARHKEFDVGQALDRAMDLFWSRGYEATSMKDLLDSMGICRQSLYDSFGDKHTLFLAALDRYGEQTARADLNELESPSASIETVRRFFDRTVKRLTSADSRRACLMLNSTMELARRDPQVARRVRANTLRMEKALANAIGNGIREGETRVARDPRALARHLTSTLYGLNIMAKEGAPRRTLQDVVEVALSTLS